MLGPPTSSHLNHGSDGLPNETRLPFACSRTKAATILQVAMAKVLIIESDAAVAKELSDALKDKGIEAQVCPDGTEGLDLAKKIRPGLIVLCVELSRGSGYS